MEHRKRGERTNGEISGNFVKELEIDRNTFDPGVFLMLEVEYRFEEDDSFILRRKHLHQGLHEILHSPYISYSFAAIVE